MSFNTLNALIENLTNGGLGGKCHQCIAGYKDGFLHIKVYETGWVYHIKAPRSEIKDIINTVC